MFEKIKENKVVSILVAGTAIALTVAAVKVFREDLSEELQEIVEEVTEQANS
jgi:hypothetical protein